MNKFSFLLYQLNIGMILLKLHGVNKFADNVSWLYVTGFFLTVFVLDMILNKYVTEIIETQLKLKVTTFYFKLLRWYRLRQCKRFLNKQILQNENR